MVWMPESAIGTLRANDPTTTDEYVTVAFSYYSEEQFARLRDAFVANTVPRRISFILSNFDNEVQGMEENYAAIAALPQLCEAIVCTCPRFQDRRIMTRFFSALAHNPALCTLRFRGLDVPPEALGQLLRTEDARRRRR